MLRHFPFRAMASPCELLLHGEDADQVEAAARAATAEVVRIEHKYSRYREDSVTAAINAGAGDGSGVAVDDETAALLDYAATAWAQSDGLFDISSGVLREVWDFRSGRVPKAHDVARVLERVGWHRIGWKDGRIRLGPGMQIDFGGYGKEYAADRAAACCRAHGIDSGLVDLGGDIAIVGPHPDDTPWRVGIRDPEQVYGAVARVELGRGGLATSGDYQRCMVVDGRRYAHILDPKTGWPIAGLRSVSVIANSCLIAGTAATIAMLKGDDGAAWLDALGLPNLRIDAKGQVSGTLSRRYGDPPSSRSPGLSAISTSPGSTTT